MAFDKAQDRAPAGLGRLVVKIIDNRLSEWDGTINGAPSLILAGARVHVVGGDGKPNGEIKEVDDLGPHLSAASKQKLMEVLAEIRTTAGRAVKPLVT